MREQCVPGSLASSHARESGLPGTHAREPGNEARLLLQVATVRPSGNALAGSGAIALELECAIGK